MSQALTDLIEARRVEDFEDKIVGPEDFADENPEASPDEGRDGVR